MNLSKQTSGTNFGSTRVQRDQLKNHKTIKSVGAGYAPNVVKPTKADLIKLEQRLTRLETQLQDTTNQITVWEDRSRSLYHNDQNKALQCLSKRNQYEAEARRQQRTVQLLESKIDKIKMYR